MTFTRFAVCGVLFCALLGGCGQSVPEPDVDGVQGAQTAADGGTKRPPVSTADALRNCMPGRCKQGEQPRNGQMPPYNLGTGYTCDNARAKKYQDCMNGRPNTAENRAECTRQADAERDACRTDPCPRVYDQCISERCTTTRNSYDCWQGTGTARQFGYWDWDPVQRKFVFHPLPGATEVPRETWERVCAGRRDRCQQGLAGPNAPPITQSFCSAACYGHNCHHAAAAVCSCIEEQTGGGAHPVVVVFDGGAAQCPQPPGNIYHSMVVLDHPTDPNKRCVIESQYSCAQHGGGVNESCCYRRGDNADYMALPNRCPLVRSGPLQEPFNLTNPSIYSCSEFLRRRGTCEAQCPPRRAALPDGSGSGSGEEEECMDDDDGDDGGDDDEPPSGGRCGMTCVQGELVPAVNEYLELCPDDESCETFEAPECPQECSPDEEPECPECPLPAPPVFRGTCAPVPDPDVDAGVDGGDAEDAGTDGDCEEAGSGSGSGGEGEDGPFRTECAHAT